MNDFIERINGYSQKRLTVLAAQLNDRIKALESRDKIAIVGIGCRFPGGVDSPESYWELLTAQRDVISEVPADRWDLDAFYDPDPDMPGKISTRYGGWLDQIDRFAAKFFAISPREAQSLDPQQRLLLEVTWRALENAGLPAADLDGTRTGVFCGISGIDYHSILRDAGTENFDAYMASGVAHSVASGRLSYFLGLHGPSLSIDTACSSSLAAIHEAIASLRNKECDVALAGGSNLILTPETTIALSRAQMMAPDGRCKTFDARANGFVRSEGCGMLVLKRLSDAERDKDQIVAVIRGSAVNQDGRSNGLTAPNGVAQESVLRDALKDADASPADIGFVEAHGTGTSLGDPIEVHALGAALCAGRDRASPLKIGSVKSSIGHLEAAAGVASLIKVALTLHHGRIPGQSNLEELNPLIQWDRYAVEPQRKTEPWSGADHKMAGVSSFGFSGTNVHVVLEQPPETPRRTAPPERRAHLVTVSARSAKALEALKNARALDLSGTADLADIAYSANTGRDHFPQRFAVVASDSQSAYAALRTGATNGAEFHGTATRKPPKIAFVFTGQGAQYRGMAKGLYDRQPVFRSAIDQYAEILDGLIAPSLLEILHDDVDIDDTALAQPALLAVELAMAALWQSWGIQPSAVLGHSLGEYTAACIAGIFSVEDAFRLVVERGRLMSSVPDDGAMASIMCSEDHIADLLSKQRAGVDIAAVNSPDTVVISGARDEIDKTCLLLEKQGVQSTRLRVSQAFHSSLMDPILDSFENFASEVTFGIAKLDLVSNVTGQLATQNMSTARYWRDHIRSTVRFHQGLETAADLGCDVFLEIGPHPALTALAQMSAATEGSTWIQTLRRDADDEAQIMSALAQLYVTGADVDWHGFDKPWPRKMVSIAGYPLERDRYWADPPVRSPLDPSESTSFPGRHISQSITNHTLLEMTFDPEDLEWINDHRIHGQLAVPSPVYMSWALQVGREMMGSDAVTLEQFTMFRPLDITDGQTRTVQFSLSPKDSDPQEFRISVQEDHDTWAVLCEGRFGQATPVLETTKPKELGAGCPNDADVSGFYDKLAGLGLEFGPRFRGATQIRKGHGQAMARIQRPAQLDTTDIGLGIHPAVIDTSLHMIAAALSLDTLDQPYLLLSVDKIESFGLLPDSFWCHVSIGQADKVAQHDTFSANLQLIDDSGRPLMRFSNMNLKRVAREDFNQRNLPEQVAGMIHEVVWRQEPAAVMPSQIENLILPSLDRRARDNGLYDTYPQFQTDLDQLCSAYIVKALKQLGLRFDTTAVVSADLLMRDFGCQAKHQRLLDRMLEILAEDGILAAEGQHWRVLNDPALPDTGSQFQALLAEFPGCEPELSVTHRCAEELADVLTGATDPLSLLFPDGSIAQTEKLYSDTAPARTYNAIVGEIVGQLVQHRRTDRPIRILEIGAGTGSATAQILGILGDRDVDYMFTDVAPLFLNTAQQRFGIHPGMRFSTFDVSQHPLAQGFSPGEYDIIVAGNVLHATADIQQTLQRVAGLMAPNAALVLLEGTTPQRFGDLTVGQLDGWWAYTDTSLRDYALMPRDAWNTVLEAVGFKDVVNLPDQQASGALQDQAIFVANWPGTRQSARTWLVVGGDECAKEAAAELEAGGDSAIRVTAPEIGATLSNDTFDAVVDLTALDTCLTEEMTAEQVVSQQKQLYERELTVVQALARLEAPPRQLCFVTSGAQAVLTDESTDPAQATLWGFAHTVAMEHPELGCRRIDLPPGKPDVAAMVSELRRMDGESQVALRNGQRHLRRLRNTEPLRAPKPVFADNETVLITGGLSGLGLLVAEWATEHGARNLILLSRRSHSSESAEAIDRMRGAGANVTVLQADVGMESDLKAVLKQAGSLPPVTTVFHAAGASDDGALISQDWSRFETVMQAKVKGSWLLQSLLPDLNHFVMFSSGASLAGSPGQANHSAANAFQDALAWYLRARGRQALTINWGLWGEVGAGEHVGVGSDAAVLRKIDPQAGLAALGAAMFAPPNQRRPQLAVLDADWDQLAHGDHANAIFFSEMAAKRQTAAKPKPVSEAKLPPLKDRLAQTPSARRRSVLLESVRAQVRTVLGLGPDEIIEAHEPLRQLGLDSLMAVQLRNLLSDDSGLALSATVIFDHPTAAALTDFLADQLFAGDECTETDPETDAVPSDRVDPYEPDTDTMSEDELARHLMQELDRLDQGARK